MRVGEAVRGRDWVPGDVLQFWFGEMDGNFPASDRSELWWGAGPDTDREVAERFAGLLQAAEASQLQRWPDLPAGRLACIIVLDQFTRMIFRGSRDAFRNDAAALALADAGVARGDDRDLPLGQRPFFYMPFMHAEDAAAQDRSVALFEKLVAETPAGQRAITQGNLDFARSHRAVYQRFGRFPHRNALLGRPSTPEETAFLAGGGATWGQSAGQDRAG